MLTKLLFALAAAGLAAGTPAAAQTIDDAVTVRFGDLDLSTAAGAATFERRLVSAAREVCGWVPREMALKADTLACQQRAIANARSDLRTALAGKGRRTLALRTD